MSKWVIIGLAATVMLLMATFYINATLERMRTRQKIKAAELYEKACRLQALIDGLPTHLISITVNKIILEEIITLLSNTLQLSSKHDNARKKLSAVKTQLKNIHDTPNDKSNLKPVKDPEELKTLRRKLTDLSTYVQTASKQRRLSNTIAEQELTLLKKLHVDVAVVYYLNLAREAQKIKKYRLGIHNYKQALAEYQKVNKNDIHSNAIADIEAAITDLQDRESKANTKTTSDHSPQSELTEGINALLSEDEAQKKKTF